MDAPIPSDIPADELEEVGTLTIRFYRHKEDHQRFFHQLALKSETGLPTSQVLFALDYSKTEINNESTAQALTATLDEELDAFLAGDLDDEEQP